MVMIELEIEARRKLLHTPRPHGPDGGPHRQHIEVGAEEQQHGEEVDEPLQDDGGEGRGHGDAVAAAHQIRAHPLGKIQVELQVIVHRVEVAI